MNNIEIFECEICGSESVEMYQIVFGNMIVSESACEECFLDGQ